MKILIGTPIHECKDYAIERWLKCVSELQLKTPADLLLVDNSPGLAYIEKLKWYCAACGITNYKLVHINVDQESDIDERMSQSREIIRREVLSKGYDAWFSWECDVLIPSNALGELVTLSDSFDKVSHEYPRRDTSSNAHVEFGITLVKREVLEKYGFIGQYGYCDPEMPRAYHGGDIWFIKRMLKDGGIFVDVYGVISPIYHLNS